MEKECNIYIDRLRGGKRTEIKETLTPEFLVNNDTVEYSSPIALEGEAYLAQDELIIHLHILTEVKTACKICGTWNTTKLDLANCYHTLPLAEVKHSVYNFREWLSATLYLETPALTECNDGNCPMREKYAVYLRKEKKNETSPFTELKIESLGEEKED